MSAVKWNPQQQSAIDCENPELLISAAAGSGKTAVLVERILRKIVENPEITIDNFFVVTFTHAAAGELKERLYKKMTEVCAQHPELESRLRPQIAMLSKAAIGTMHSFCLRLLQEHHAHPAVMLPVNIHLLSQAQADLFLQEALEEVLTQEYAGEEAADFRLLLDAFSDMRQDKAVRNMILELYRSARNHPSPRSWLEQVASPEAQAGIYKTWYEFVKKQMLSVLENSKELAEEQALPEAARTFFLTARQIAQRVINAIDEGNYYAAQQRINEAKSQLILPRASKTDDVSVAGVKKLAKAIKENCFGKLVLPLPEDVQEENALRPAVEALCRLALSLDQAFSQKKRKNRAVDFGDLEHMGLNLLCDEAVAQIYRQKFRHILFDEYQDCNQVQEAIVQKISSNASYFMVGDIKQSIYGFRNADPELFLRKYHEYTPAPCEGCGKIELNTNYRSRGGVLNAVNNVFFRIMTEDFCGMGYGKESALYDAPDRFPEGGSFAKAPAAAALFTAPSNAAKENEEEEEDGQEAALSGTAIVKSCQAAYIAREIKQMVERGDTVLDRDSNQYRPVRYSDIAVLMRSPASGAKFIQNVFRDCGIPLRLLRDEDITFAPEISLFVNLLYAIENPYHEIALLGVLASYLFGLTEEELVKLASFEKKETPCLADKIVRYIALAQDPQDPLLHKLRDFESRMAFWRERERMMPIDEFIDFLLADTCYESFFASMENGQARRNHIRAFRGSLLSQLSARPGGIFECVELLVAMEETEGFRAKAGSEAGDRVTLMSVHQSKGLEYPIVFVAFANSLFNGEDYKKNYLIHSRLGIATKSIDVKNRVVKESFSYEVLKRIMQHQQRMEEQRILYVAMTRAREKLYITGGAAKNNLDRWRFPKLLGDWSFANNWLDWILCALSEAENPPVPAPEERRTVETQVTDCPEASFPCRWELTNWKCAAQTGYYHSSVNYVLSCGGEETSVEQIAAGPARLQQDIPQLLQEEAVDMAQLLDKLNYEYPYKSTAQLPSKLSVTQLRTLFASQQELEEVEVPTYRYRLENTAPQAHLTPAELGTLFHFFMQHASVEYPYTRETFEKDKQRMLDRRLITQVQTQALDCGRVQSFFNCEEGKKLVNAPFLEREKSISFLLPAREIYPDSRSSEPVLVQGVVDCVFQDEAGRLVIVDYKTDRIPQGENENFLIEKYQVQLALYGRALEKILNVPVAGLYIYSSYLKKWIKLQAMGILNKNMQEERQGEQT